ncbi:MAG TPA: ATP-binding cassette domain-containing protein [Ignavibacteriaceae bacterium]|nr:ATP-binding cassette domain-containing protein [Ignavibacteriaceae bacterium]
MILELQNITFTFPGKSHLLDDVCLLLQEETIYALMGSNGAGKTTLFNLITGFIKPQSGEIIFCSEKIKHFSSFSINRKGIGRTFQDLRLITKLTVKENIILAMQNKPGDNWFNAMLPESFNRNSNQVFNKKADDIVEQFFLSDVINSFAAEISYGQQKLLSLACCVANGASLLLIDEAVAGIQPEYRKKISLLIKQLKDQGKTIFLIEHNTDFISDVVDKIYFLHEGKISTFDNLESLRNDKMVMEAYV